MKQKSLLTCSNGATAVEFAFIAPLILLAIAGSFQAGSYFYGVHAVQRLTESTSREVRLLENPTLTEIEALLNAKMGVKLAGRCTPDIQIIEEYGETFADIRVTYSYDLQLPLLPNPTFTTIASKRALLRS